MNDEILHSVQNDGTNMIILGIDPGIADTGYGVIKKDHDAFRAKDFGTITTKKTDTLVDRLQQLFDAVAGLIKKHKPERIAVEQLFFAKNAKTAITVAHARGVILLAARTAGCEVHEYTPLQVKQALTGYGAADKKQIQRMVKTILSLKAIPKPDDAADALAIAICAGQTNHSLSLRSALGGEAIPSMWRGIATPPAAARDDTKRFPRTGACPLG